MSLLNFLATCAGIGFMRLCIKVQLIQGLGRLHSLATTSRWSQLVGFQLGTHSTSSPDISTSILCLYFQCWYIVCRLDTNIDWTSLSTFWCEWYYACAENILWYIGLRMSLQWYFWITSCGKKSEKDLSVKGAMCLISTVWWSYRQRERLRQSCSLSGDKLYTVLHLEGVGVQWQLVAFTHTHAHTYLYDPQVSVQSL